MDVIILGRKIGIATGWDELDQNHLAFYDFEPSENVDMEKCGSISVDYITGVIVSYNGEGAEIISTKDAGEIIRYLPKHD